jgi:hypothetical protein
VNVINSRDGTALVFDRIGDGPPLVLVGDGPTNRSGQRPLAQLLASRFTVLNYDRLGRGESGNTPTYAVDREVEDRLSHP